MYQAPVSGECPPRREGNEGVKVAACSKCADAVVGILCALKKMHVRLEVDWSLVSKTSRAVVRRGRGSTHGVGRSGLVV